MAKSSGLILIVLMVFAPISVVTAKVVYVDVNSPSDPGTGTASDPFRRIQDAISDAGTGSGDQIEIRPGIYTGPGNYNINPNGFAITIRSSDPNDPDIVASTIIDPNRAGRGFDFHKGESRDCILAGLTIRNGYAASESNGGGIKCSLKSRPTIRNCVIQDCESDSSGGGIHCDEGGMRIENCIIKNNSAGYYGGGISIVDSSDANSPVIDNCVITGNNSGFEGGGIDSGKSTPIFSNCIISDNTAASNGGGIDSFWDSSIELINCTLAANEATFSGGGVYCQFGGGIEARNSILWANQSIEGSQIALPFVGTGSSASVYHSDVQGGQSGVFVGSGTLTWGSGNIDTDPNFASFDTAIDPGQWDFHLSSEAGRWDADIQDWVNDEFTSPCVDAGYPNSDYSIEPWPHGGRINMGVYGGTRQASMNGNRADFNIDGAVNLVDFAEFAKQWLRGEACIEDMTGDSKVDSTDLAILAYNWLWQTQ
jgi:hypothetical protein